MWAGGVPHYEQHRSLVTASTHMRNVQPEQPTPLCRPSVLTHQSRRGWRLFGKKGPDKRERLSRDKSCYVIFLNIWECCVVIAWWWVGLEGLIKSFCVVKNKEQSWWGGGIFVSPLTKRDLRLYFPSFSLFSVRSARLSVALSLALSLGFHLVLAGTRWHNIWRVQQRPAGLVWGGRKGHV